MPMPFKLYQPSGSPKRIRKPTHKSMRRMFEFQITNSQEFCCLPDCNRKRNSRSRYCSKHKVMNWLYKSPYARGMYPFEYEQETKQALKLMKTNPDNEYLLKIKKELTDVDSEFHRVIFSRIRDLNLVISRMLGLWLFYYTQAGESIIKGIDHLNVLVGDMLLSHLEMRIKIKPKQRKVFGKYLNKKTGTACLFLIKEILKQKGEI